MTEIRMTEPLYSDPNIVVRPEIIAIGPAIIPIRAISTLRLENGDPEQKFGFVRTLLRVIAILMLGLGLIIVVAILLNSLGASRATDLSPLAGAVILFAVGVLAWLASRPPTPAHCLTLVVNSGERTTIGAGDAAGLQKIAAAIEQALIWSNAAAWITPAEQERKEDYVGLEQD